jgi:hypothetical protein
LGADFVELRDINGCRKRENGKCFHFMESLPFVLFFGNQSF